MYRLWITLDRLNIMDIVLNRFSACFAQSLMESTTYANSRLRSCPHRHKVLTGWLRGGETPPLLCAVGAATDAP